MRATLIPVRPPSSESWTIVGVIASIVAAVASLAAAGHLYWADLQRWHHKRLVFTWLLKNTNASDRRFQYRSTRAIASGTNLSEDRVREICSIHPRIHLSTGEQPDKWRLR